MREKKMTSVEVKEEEQMTGDWLTKFKDFVDGECVDSVWMWVRVRDRESERG